MQIFKLFFKDKKGAKVEYDIGANAVNVQEDSSHRFITDVERQQWNAKLEEKDLGAAAKYAVANNDTTTVPGFLADARIVKQHGDEIDQINSDLDGNRFGHTADGRPGWKDGADTVHPFNNILVLMDGTTSAAFAGVSVTNYSTFVLNNFDYSNYSKIRITNMGPYGYQVTCGTQLITADGTYDVSGLKSDKLQVFYRGNTTNPNIMLRVELIP